jgi:hypothetical protein
MSLSHWPCTNGPMTPLDPGRSQIHQTWTFRPSVSAPTRNGIGFDSTESQRFSSKISKTPSRPNKQARDSAALPVFGANPRFKDSSPEGRLYAATAACPTDQSSRFRSAAGPEDQRALDSPIEMGLRASEHTPSRWPGRPFTGGLGEMHSPAISCRPALSLALSTSNKLSPAFAGPFHRPDPHCRSHGAIRERR